MERRTYPPSWDAVWKILSGMQGLCELYVDLDAYLESEAFNPEIEADIFEPLVAVRVASKYVVRVPWLLTVESSSINLPFVVERPRGRKDMIQEKLHHNGHFSRSYLQPNRGQLVFYN